jgi:hypothetical protein
LENGDDVESKYIPRTIAAAAVAPPWRVRLSVLGAGEERVSSIERYVSSAYPIRGATPGFFVVRKGERMENNTD